MEPLQVIAAPRRLRILELVWDRELSAGDIAREFECPGRRSASTCACSRRPGSLSSAGRGPAASTGPTRPLSGRSARSSKTTGGAAWDGSRTWPKPSSVTRTVMADDNAVEVSVYIAAEPETVFPYFIDPGRYVQWMGRDATLEAVPGGSYRIFMREGVEAVGEFVEIDPPRRVVFTWGWTTTPPSRPAPRAWSSRCTPSRTAPASCCAITACPRAASAIITARAGRCT